VLLVHPRQGCHQPCDAVQLPGKAFPPPSLQAYWGLIGTTLAAGAFSSLGSIGVRIAVEKCAVQAMLHGHPEALAKANAGARCGAASWVLEAGAAHTAWACTSSPFKKCPILLEDLCARTQAIHAACMPILAHSIGASGE